MSGFGTSGIPRLKIASAGPTVPPAYVQQRTDDEPAIPNGVVLGACGSVRNGAIASILGSNNAILVTGGSGTVVNAGSVEGTNNIGVNLSAGGNNRLVLDPGAVFNGGVVADSGTNTLELARGASAGTIGATPRPDRL